MDLPTNGPSDQRHGTPDNHYSEFFKNAGENFIKAMEVMMNIGWRKGWNGRLP